jgi:hypothetical protein
MDFTKLFRALESGLKTVTELAEAGEAFGLPSQVADAAKIAGTLLEAGANVKTLIENGKIVASGGDKARIDAILADLQEVNDGLASKIAAS